MRFSRAGPVVMYIAKLIFDVFNKHTGLPRQGGSAGRLRAVYFCSSESVEETQNQSLADFCVSSTDSEDEKETARILLQPCKRAGPGSYTHFFFISNFRLRLVCS